MRRIILTILAVVFATTTTFAVPNLQLYIPDADYDAVSETWVTTASTFEVWVVAANLNHGDIYDISLVASLMGESPTDGALTITPEGGSPVSYDADDYIYGTPPLNDPMPPHGIFPTDYVEMAVASVTTSGPFEEVQDYIPGEDPGTSLYGQIFKFSVSTTYAYVHFDVYGYYDDPNGRRIFAPFSHDAETVVPEPATMLLLGVGLVGGGLIRRFRG